MLYATYMVIERYKQGENMNKLLQLLFVTSLLNAYPDIPDELTGEMLKEMPAEVLDEFLDELRDTDEDSVTIDSFLADGNSKLMMVFNYSSKRRSD